MGYQWITVKGSAGEKSFKVSKGSDEFWVYDSSENSIGKTRSLEDAIALVKSTYGKQVWNVDIGSEQSGCFAASTLILTPTGGKRIKDLVRGDEVISLAGNLAALTTCRVTNRLDHPRVLLWEVRTTLGAEPVRSTAIHSFLSTRGWMRTEQISVGDELIAIQSGKTCNARVLSVGISDQQEPVFNLHTTAEHNFIADSLVAHNFSYFRSLRTLFHRILVDPFVESEPQRGDIAA